MSLKLSLAVILSSLSFTATAYCTAQEPATQEPAAKSLTAQDKTLVRREWQIDGVTRESLLFIPPAARQRPSPVVFTFHGHGGNMRQVANSFAMHKHWPEAIVVYMQGLKTPGRLTDPEGKRPGWQSTVGDQGDRDLKFFDAVLASLKQDYQVDGDRIYATGHSNGGGFTYLLWGARGDLFAAVAPSAAVGARQLKSMKPKPVLHIAGENDELVKFEWQKLMLERVRKLNGCDEGQPWENSCTLYPSKSGTPVITMVHSGGHKFSKDAPLLIVKFFQQYPKRPPE